MDALFPRNISFLRKRHQILFIFISILFQTILLMFFPLSNYVDYGIAATTSFLCLIASVAGITLINSLGRYPGVEESSYIFPSMTVSYGVLMLILLMLRVPYSRFLIASTFATNLLLLSILYAALRRTARLRIGVVPVGHYQDVTVMPNVEWHILDGPDSDVQKIDAISVDLWSDLSASWERRLATYALEGVPVYDLKHLKESLTGQVQIKHLSENNLGTLRPLYAWMRIKYITDWVFALIAGVLLAPFLVIVAVIVRIDSPGPAIFRQTRIGYRGKPFQVFKLRTMTVVPLPAEGDGATPDDIDAAVTKSEDRRITRVGRFLRKSRIDELPQLINVLRGEMSWIGPRPEAQVLSQWYEREIPFYPYRHIVRPGISGWAQVHQGHVADVADVTDKLHFDFYYIKHFSLWIDLIIVGRTIRTMLTGFGAR